MKTLDELDFENCPLHRRTPYGMQGVSMGQLSVARHSGGCKFNGDHYVYNPVADELVRTDVLKWAKTLKPATP